MRDFLLEVKLSDVANETERQYLRKYQELNCERIEADEKIESMYPLIDDAGRRRNFIAQTLFLSDQEKFYMVSINCENKMKALEESPVLKALYERFFTEQI